jgi:hypothetical protein
VKTDSCAGVSPGGDDEVEGGMDLQIKHSGEMAVIVTDHFVVLQIPA